MGESNNNAWALALAAVVFGGMLYLAGRRKQTVGANGQPTLDDREEPSDDNSSLSDGLGSSTHTKQPTREELARQEAGRAERERQVEAAKARVQEVERQAGEARAKRQQKQKEADDAKAKREEMERQASQAKNDRESKEKEADTTKEDREKVEERVVHAQASNAEGTKLIEVSDKTSKAMAGADSARIGTLRAIGEGVVTNIGGQAARVVTNQVLGSVGVLEATKNAVEASEEGESVADPLVSGALSFAQKAANVAQRVPLAGPVVTAAQVSYAVGKDFKAQIEAEKSVDALADRASTSQNPQIRELAEQHARDKKEVMARRDEAMAEGPLGPDDDYAVVKPLLNAAASSTKLDKELTAGVKHAAGEQVAKAAAEAEALQREAEELRAREARLKEDAEKARKAEEDAKNEARRAAEEEQAKTEAAREAEETEKALEEKLREEKSAAEKLSAPAEAESTPSPPNSSGGGVVGYLYSLLSSSQTEVEAEKTNKTEVKAEGTNQPQSGAGDGSGDRHGNSGGSDSDSNRESNRAREYEKAYSNRSQDDNPPRPSRAEEYEAAYAPKKEESQPRPSRAEEYEAAYNKKGP